MKDEDRVSMRTLLDVAPEGEVSAYDRRNLVTYAELLDAADAGVDWASGAVSILGFDPDCDPETTRRCWETHLVRARWIVGDGLASALEAFGRNSKSG